MTEPSVSLVITTHNGLDHLRALLPTVRELDYPRDRFEVIVADDQSTDGSEEFVRRQYSEYRWVRNPRHLHFVRTAIHGASHAEGEILVLLNNDTRLDSGWLKELVMPFAKDPQCAATTSKMLDWEGKWVNYNGVSINLQGYGFEKACERGAPEEITENREVLTPCGGAMATRRSVWLETGGFDPGFTVTYEDVDYGWRLNLLGYRVLYCADSILYHRLHATLGTVNYPDRAPRLDGNGLRMIYKNVGDENLHRLLALALALSHPRTTALREGGLKDFWRRSGPAKRLMMRAARWLIRQADPGLEIAGSAGRVHVDAVTHFLRMFPEVHESRKKVQSARTVPDEIIFQKFFPEPIRLWAFNDDHRRWLEESEYGELAERLWDVFQPGE